MNEDPSATPDMQARYDILAQEVRRERAEVAKMKDLCGQVIEDTAKALGCEPDNEAILEEIAALRRALGLNEVAQ